MVYVYVPETVTVVIDIFTNPSRSLLFSHFVFLHEGFKIVEYQVFFAC